MDKLDVFTGAMLVLIMVSPLVIGLEAFRVSLEADPQFITDYLIVSFESLLAYFLLKEN